MAIGNGDEREADLKLDYDTLQRLREHDPAWRFLRADYASLIAAVLHRVFVDTNQRRVPRAQLIQALEHQMYSISQDTEHVFGKKAEEYLDDWATPEKGWLRIEYLPGTDEQVIDLTAQSVKVLDWLAGLEDRSTFVGTASRLLTVVELLRQIARGSETDPEKRLADLHKRREEIDAEIARVMAGDIPLLEDAAIKDRFQQAQDMARGILSDFRAVEANFRTLDRSMRERIASFDGSKGELLEEMIGERNSITDSDQGRSFRAFWEFLLSAPRQEELTELLDQILKLPAVEALQPDRRMRRIHYDWIEAGEHTQRTVASLSQQFRQFLDDRAYLENRRIMDVLRALETAALELRDKESSGDLASLVAPGLDIRLPLERPLHKPKAKVKLAELVLELGDDAALDTSVLFDQVSIDHGALRDHIHDLLEDRSQVTLYEVVTHRPLAQGLAELVAYLQIAARDFESAVDASVIETIEWTSNDDDGAPAGRRAQLPRVIYLKDAAHG